MGCHRLSEEDINMFNSIKAKLFLNAFKNLKVSAKSGGNGSFKMKGLQFDLPRKEIVH